MLAKTSEAQMRAQAQHKGHKMLKHIHSLSFISMFLMMNSTSAHSRPLEAGLDCLTTTAEATLGLVDAKIRRSCFSGDYLIEVRGLRWDQPRYSISFVNGRPQVKDLLLGVPTKAQLLAGPEYTLPILSISSLEDSGEEAITIVTRLMIVPEASATPGNITYKLKALDLVRSFQSYNRGETQVEHYSGAELQLSRIQPKP